MQQDPRQATIAEVLTTELPEMISRHTIEEMVRLHDKVGVPLREIARSLHIDRKTVRKYISHHKAGDLDKKAGLRPGRVPVLGQIDQEKLKELFLDFDGHCVPMHRRLKAIFGVDPPSLRATERHCSQWRHELRRHRQARDRYETHPGDYMQIDFGERDVLINGQTTRVHIFVAILSYSRRIFACTFESEKAGNWLDGIEKAFQYFGGMPKRILSDNAKALVMIPPTDSAPAVFNPTYRKFCAYHAVEPEACYAYYPEMKGKVERAVGYIKHDFLEAGQIGFSSLAKLNEELLQWLSEVADRRRMDGLTIPVPRDRYEQVEKESLRPYRNRPSFNEYKEFKRKTGVGALVRVDNETYQLDMKYARLEVDVLAGPDHIHVSYRGNRIQTFKRGTDAVKRITYTIKYRDAVPNKLTGLAEEHAATGHETDTRTVSGVSIVDCNEEAANIKQWSLVAEAYQGDAQWTANTLH